MEFDHAFFKKNGNIKESDYNSLSRKIIKEINPLQIQNIRKNMEFISLDYSEYMEGRNKEFLIGEESLPLDLNCISIPFITSFSSRYFPSFEEEFLNPYGYLKFLDEQVILEEIEDRPLKSLVNGNFHSLSLAAYFIEKKIKELYKDSPLYKITEDFNTIVDFFIPNNIGINFNIMIRITITLFF
jgi:hypothetical protein